MDLISIKRRIDSQSSTVQVLHVNTLRWISKFNTSFAREMDPMRRFIGKLDGSGRSLFRAEKKTT